MKPIRILIADDHAVVLEGLVALIGRQSDMKIVAQASNGREAVEEWNNHRPDVSLLDLRMPALDAVGVINRIRETDPAARCLVLTTFDTDEDIYKAVKSGAKGYLLKDAPRDILLESIRKVHAGETCLAPELTAKLVERLSSASLTDRELEVLTLLVRGKGTRETLARPRFEDIGDGAARQNQELPLGCSRRFGENVHLHENIMSLPDSSSPITLPIYLTKSRL